jgi:hypothetical protein
MFGTWSQKQSYKHEQFFITILDFFLRTKLSKPSYKIPALRQHMRSREQTTALSTKFGTSLFLARLRYFQRVVITSIGHNIKIQIMIFWQQVAVACDQRESNEYLIA